MRTSRGGEEERVAVGRMDWDRACGKLGGRVEMGERVVERRERVTGGVVVGDQERTLRTSRGPKTSRAWKPGKRRTPMRRGEGVEESVIVGRLCVVVMVVRMCEWR